jgi:hypothetical protein
MLQLINDAQYIKKSILKEVKESIFATKQHRKISSSDNFQPLSLT